VLALFAGWAALQFLAMHGRSAAMPWGGALLGLAVSALVGAVAGVAPARRAAALDPVQTLR
jgi:ABC-type antimicrobial peptide transport system permease subunit